MHTKMLAAIGSLWLLGFSASAEAQTPVSSRGTQVVLLVRTPDGSFRTEGFIDPDSARTWATAQSRQSGSTAQSRVVDRPKPQPEVRWVQVPVYCHRCEQFKAYRWELKRRCPQCGEFHLNP